MNPLDRCSPDPRAALAAAVLVLLAAAPAARSLSLDSPDWSQFSSESGAQLGFDVTSAGDVDGDGFEDILVGTPRADAGGPTNRGVVTLHYGSASGPSMSPDWENFGADDGDMNGWSVAGGGDFNGDGYDDFLVGRPFADSLNTDCGEVWVWYGSPTGPQSPQVLLSSLAGGQYGERVAIAGDVNNDGYDDALVGAPNYQSGRARLYLGSPAGLPTSSSWSALAQQSSERLGISVAGAGDVDGDGYDDVIIGAHFHDANGYNGAGRAVCYLGGPSGPAATPAWEIFGDGNLALLGQSVDGAGDVNGDGYDDVVVGAFGAASEAGIAYVHLGSASGLDPVAWQTIEGDEAGAGLGFRVAGAGDLNADGHADLALAEQYPDGEVRVYTGDADGLFLWAEGAVASAGWFGHAIAPAGDVNADGYADLIVGDILGGICCGGAYVYYGEPTPTWPGDDFIGTTTDGGYGSSVATAGDVNGDGYADVVIGAPHELWVGQPRGAAYLHHGSADGLTGVQATLIGGVSGDELGACVAPAGDVDADGFADWIVTAPGSDATGPDHGKVQVLSGGQPFPAGWHLDGTVPSGDFGRSAAWAGDVNRDGYDDVVVGAPQAGTGGEAYLYLGSATGPVTPAAQVFTTTQPGAELGISVATAGDVNGDGYDDVIVGAKSWDTPFLDQGVAYVYHGGAAGPDATPDGTLTVDELAEELGTSVSTAGDRNGDGYADVVVGAPGASGEAGAAYVFLGSPSGVGGAPDETLTIAGLGRFGHSVACAGDADQDGVADVLVGALGTSGAGSGYAIDNQSFTNSIPAWVAGAGACVASAGDIDGDGHVEHIVGAPQSTATIARQGAALVHEAPRWVYYQPITESASSLDSGDVNGDGIDDIVRGFVEDASEYGSVYVHLGQDGARPDSVPAWNYDGTQFRELVGSAVGVGDANGDGIDDILVGAEGLNTVHFFAGTTGTLPATPDWSHALPGGGRFGAAISYARDFDGDGFGDFVIGAPIRDDTVAGQGAAFVLRGSATGPQLPLVELTELVELDANAGSSVAGLGDVNGDGRDDVGVGVPGWDGGSTDMGAATVFYGSDGVPARESFYGEQDGERFGTAVATLGDENHDGLPEFGVGSPYWDGPTSMDAGRVSVFRADPTTVSFDRTETVDYPDVRLGASIAVAGDYEWEGYTGWVTCGLNTSGAYPGAVFFDDGEFSAMPTPATIVATGGDFTGDGMPDFVSGAPETGDAGTLTFFFKPVWGVAGPDHFPETRPLQLTTAGDPIAHGGVTADTDGLRIQAVVRSPAGRAPAELIVQVAPVGVPFPPATATGWIDTGAVQMNGSHRTEHFDFPLTPDKDYRWRLRIRTKSPFFAATPWLSDAPATWTSPAFRVQGAAGTGVDVTAFGDGTSRLRNIWPSPFRTGVTTSFSIARREHARLDVFDVTGRRVTTLVDGVLEPGAHRAEWDGKDAAGRPVATGVYFTRLQAGEEVSSRKVVRVR